MDKMLRSPEQNSLQRPLHKRDQLANQEQPPGAHCS